MMTKSMFSSHRRQTGFSLVELMVALVIGLIVSLAVFQVLQTYEGKKRTTTSVNDINQAGNYAIFVLDKLVRSAGNGITQGDSSFLGCVLNAAKSGAQIFPRVAALPAPFAAISTDFGNTFRLAPLLIVPAVGPNDSDALIIMGGNAGYGEMAIAFADQPKPAQLTLNNTLGFSTKDVILLRQPSMNGNCLLTQANAVNATAGIITLSGDYYSATVNGVKITDYLYNPDPAMSAVASNLGNIANNNPPTFVVVGAGDPNTLFGFDLLHSQNPTENNNQVAYPIADSVWGMYARYGVDTNNDGIVDIWTKAEGDYAPSALTTPNAIQTIKAVRIGLIMRTSLYERDPVTASAVTLFGDLGDSLKVTATPAAGSDAEHYRYRTIEATIPLRNMLGI
ncbi:MAG: PilW family protein [Desulfobulbus sp.]|nr:PilW family protein [Desulfobulbus sp.]